MTKIKTLSNNVGLSDGEPAEVGDGVAVLAGLVLQHGREAGEGPGTAGALVGLLRHLPAAAPGDEVQHDTAAIF